MNSVHHKTSENGRVKLKTFIAINTTSNTSKFLNLNVYSTINCLPAKVAV